MVRVLGAPADSSSCNLIDELLSQSGQPAVSRGGVTATAAAAAALPRPPSGAEVAVEVGDFSSQAGTCRAVTRWCAGTFSFLSIGLESAHARPGDSRRRGTGPATGTRNAGGGIAVADRSQALSLAPRMPSGAPRARR